MRKNLWSRLSYGLNYILLILIFFFIVGVFFRLPVKYYNEILLLSAVFIVIGLIILIVRRFAELLRLKSGERTIGMILRKTASVTIHFSVILILIAWFLSSYFSHGVYREGQEMTSLDLTQSGFAFDIAIENVRADFYGDGSPRQYATSFAIEKDSKKVATGTASVNHPFTYHGTKIYQYGYTETRTGTVTGLYIKTDPGVPWLYAGAVCVLLSIAVKLLSHQFRGGQVKKC